MQSYDVIVIGGGIAGLSAAAVLAEDLSVLVCETEPGSDRHATGRSAAAFIASYGNGPVLALTAASRPWFDSLGEGWAEHALLHPRPALWIADSASAGIAGTVAALAGAVATSGLPLDAISAEETAELCPVIVEQWRSHSLLDRLACDIDVAGATAALRRQLLARGGQLHFNARVRGLRRRGDAWTVSLADAQVSAGVVVNAAGAWADQVAQLAGLAPVGLTPLRRTVATCAVPPAESGIDPWTWPMVLDVEDSFYFKPERAQVLVSPADESPTEPGDAKPEPLDVAIALERVNAATTLALRSVQTAWAGLRTFAPDRTPVVGPDPAEPSFVWAAGQGGYGITISPAVAQLVGTQVAGRAAPPALVGRAALATELSPARFRVR